MAVREVLSPDDMGNLQALTQHPGWQVFKRFMQRQIAMHTRSMVMPTPSAPGMPLDPALLWRAGGIVAQTELLMSWPENTVRAYQEQLKKQIPGQEEE